MWICSKLGFFSIVKKADGFYVRARSVSDLKNLKVATGLDNEIKQWAGTDYVARIIVDTVGLVLVMDALTATIDYHNFKNAIAKDTSQKDKGKYYAEVWGVMFDYQNDISWVKSETEGKFVKAVDKSKGKGNNKKGKPKGKISWESDSGISDIKMPKSKRDKKNG